MTDKADLPDGGWVEIRTELTGGDQKWYLIQSDRLRRSNGTGKPASVEPDPDNPAVLREVPAVAAELTAEDNIALLDMLAGRLLVSWSLPGVLPWTPEMRESMDLDVTDAIDTEVVRQRSRLLGIGPKRKNAPTSGSTSEETAPAPQTEPTGPPSSTAPGS